MQKSFSDLPKSEQEDFIQACKAYGWPVEAFQVVFQVGYPVGDGPVPIAREITVKSTLTGVSKFYNGGNGTSWTVEFEDHLKARKFGKL